MESILTSIKKLLGIGEEDTYFDPDIITHINSVFTILKQLGVGPPEGFRIEDDTSVWTDFIPDTSRLEAVKSYVHKKVQLLFDPPTGGAPLQAVKEITSEFEWRLNVEAESEEEISK